MVPQNNMKVRRRKRGDWSGKSESGSYAVTHSLRTPLPPTGGMTRTRMMERPFLRTRRFKLCMIKKMCFGLLYVCLIVESSTIVSVFRIDED